MKHGLKITTLILILPLFAPGQSRIAQHRSRPVAKILRPVLQKIKNQANAPIFLPSKLPTSVNTNEIHVVEGEDQTGGWKISLFYKAGCGDACFAGLFEAKSGETVSRDDVDKIVRLTNGTRGYYTARSCGGSCTPPQINWVYKNVLYTIQFNVNNKTRELDEAEIIALANSAIQGGAR